MPDDFLVMIGNNIRKYRYENNITQKELGNKINIDPANLSKMECGHTNARLLLYKKIADALGISILDLFSDHSL